MEEGREEKNSTVRDTEIELERLVGELTAEHLDTVQNFAATINVGMNTSKQIHGAGYSTSLHQ